MLLLAPERHARLVAVADEEQRVDHAGQRVLLPPRSVVRSDLDVLRPDGDVGLRARDERDARARPGPRGCARRAVR